MLLFKPFLIEEILAGRKTETRWLWPHGARVTLYSVQSVQPDLRSNFQKAPPACHVKIGYLYQELLGEITPESVRKEGFADGNVPGFIKGWKGINAKKAPSEITLESWNPEVWVVGFALYVQPKPIVFQKLI